MAAKQLRFYAAGDSLVPDFEALEAGIRRFVGRKHCEVEPGLFGFAPLDEPSTVADRAEYIKSCQAGELLPADAETAKRCDVPFAKPAPTPAPLSSLADRIGAGDAHDAHDIEKGGH